MIMRWTITRITWANQMIILLRNVSLRLILSNWIALYYIAEINITKNDFAFIPKLAFSISLCLLKTLLESCNFIMIILDTCRERIP